MMMMNRASMQGGVMNFLGKQPEVTAPIRAQSHADSPPVELAYITDAEKDLLVKANIHGSMAGKPNPGPAGIASLDDFFNLPGGGVGGGNPDRGETYASAEDYGIKPGMAVGGGDQGTGGQVFQGTDVVPAPGQADRPGTFVPVIDEKQKQLEALAEANRLKTVRDLNERLGIVTPDKGGVFSFSDLLSDLKPTLSDQGRRFFGSMKDFPSFFGIGVKALDALRGPTPEKFRDPNYLAGLKNYFDTEKEFEGFVKEFEDEIKEGFAGEDRDYKELVEAGELPENLGEDLKNRIETSYNRAREGELGSDLQQRTNPVGYYTDDKGKVINFPATSAQAKEMVESFRFANLDEDPAYQNLTKTQKRRLTAAIMEAQAMDYDRQTRQDANMRQTTDPNEGSFSKPFTPLPGPRPGPVPDPRPGPIQQEPGLPFFPFPSTGIASVFNPAFMGPNFDPRMSNYARQGRGAFDQFYQNLERFPVV